jgi:DNA-binding SARP family transcriptional activator
MAFAASRNTRPVGARCQAAPRLRIRLLGGFQVEVGARVVLDQEWPLQKSRAVVKLLALEPRHRVNREELMERLWPEAEPDAALNNLYYALHVARRAVDGGVARRRSSSPMLQLTAGVLALAPGGSIFVDIEAFQAAARTALQSKDPRAFDLALDLYTGELLPDDPYADWATCPRERLRDLHLQLLSGLAHLHHERGDFQQAIDTLRRLVLEEPADEDSRTHLMRLYASLGQRRQAAREYSELRRALRAELDIEPGATTQRLYAEILAGAVAAEARCKYSILKSLSPVPSTGGGQSELSQNRGAQPAVALSR